MIKYVLHHEACIALLDNQRCSISFVVVTRIYATLSDRILSYRSL